MTESHCILALLDDEPGVLDRVAALCRRRAFNIQSLTVSPASEPGTSRMTLVVEATELGARRVVAHLEKLVNVQSVDLLQNGDLARDLCLARVACGPASRPAVLQLAEVFRARVVDLAADSLVLECTGNRTKVDRFIDVLRPFGLLDLGRSGAVAMARTPADPAFAASA
ncbi:MAG TPA: acetolactate synthase small subunit [Holophagaceae bacterium]|nr:acetolactate synthase small subunit [Holophagaceae bacterium]